ncbi:hypothetical protein ACFWN5_25155 [Streptomyces sp. NPDC058430]|uniref:hypothetical protein n=1 Tax=Streptomyces sp. NPDC058430 TaxID=3346495 RepID=UPI00365ECC91
MAVDNLGNLGWLYVRQQVLEAAVGAVGGHQGHELLAVVSTVTPWLTPRVPP